MFRCLTRNFFIFEEKNCYSLNLIVKGFFTPYSLLLEQYIVLNDYKYSSFENIDFNKHCYNPWLSQITGTGKYLGRPKGYIDLHRPTTVENFCSPWDYFQPTKSNLSTARGRGKTASDVIFVSEALRRWRQYPAGRNNTEEGCSRITW